MEVRKERQREEGKDVGRERGRKRRRRREGNKTSRACTSTLGWKKYKQFCNVKHPHSL